MSPHLRVSFSCGWLARSASTGRPSVRSGAPCRAGAGSWLDGFASAVPDGSVADRRRAREAEATTSIPTSTRWLQRQGHGETPAYPGTALPVPRCTPGSPLSPPRPASAMSTSTTATAPAGRQHPRRCCATARFQSRSRSTLSAARTLLSGQTSAGVSAAGPSPFSRAAGPRNSPRTSAGTPTSRSAQCRAMILTASSTRLSASRRMCFQRGTERIPYICDGEMH
ncbi:MAG: hypothetical protein JWP76_3691 [Dactylosporangium sp.]|nr:hypothetical protein [Dactylosporangium sp.]